MLDLTEFASRDCALELAALGCPKAYTAIARTHLEPHQHITQNFMLFAAVVSRMRGLHEAVVREIEAGNPHAVLPLTRAWVEVITIALYICKKPAYAEFVMHGPGPNRPGKKSFEAMFNVIKDEAEQVRLVYGELSEYSHFGPLAVWNAHSIEDEDERLVTWTDAPRWRDEKHFQIACARAHELAVAGQQALNRFGSVLIPPPLPG